MVWWILLGVLIFLLLLPLGVRILYDASGFRVQVTAGFLRFTIFPMKKKAPKKEKANQEKPVEDAPKPATAAQQKTAAPEKKEQTPLPEAPKPPAPEKESGGSIMDFLPLVELVLKFLGEFFHRTLHIDVLYLKLTLAGNDPADLAISYGKAWAALGNLWPYIDRMLTIKKRDIQIQCDFEATEPLVNARVDISLTLGRLLGLILSYGVRMLIKFVRILWQRKQKAGSVHQKVSQSVNNEKAV